MKIDENCGIIVRFMQPTPIKKSLRSKIFLRFTVLVGITIIATSTLSIFIARSSIKTNTIADLLSFSGDRGQIIAQMLDEHRTLTRLIASDRDVIHLMSNAKTTGSSSIRNHLLQQTSIIPELETIVLLDTNGIITVATDSRLEQKDLSEHEYFTRGSKGILVGHLNVAQANRTYAISIPLRNDSGELLGVLIAEYAMNSLYSALSGAKKLGQTGEYLLMDPRTQDHLCFNPQEGVFSARGAISFALSKNDIASNIGIGTFSSQGVSSPLCSLAATGQAGILESRDRNGNSVIAASYFMHDIGLGLIVKVDEKEIYKPVQLLMSVLVGTTGLLLLFVIFIALRLSNDVVNPIFKLRKSLLDLNTGHWGHERSVFTGDELEILDIEVGRLSLRLKEAYSSLERRVLERTQELDEQHSKDEALLESIGEGFLAIDMSGKIITCNRSAEQMLKWDKDQIVGSHFSSVLSLRSKDKQLLSPNEHHIQRAIQEKKTIRTMPEDTSTCERKDGTSFPIAIAAMPFLMGMEMKGVVVTFRDITEEKRISRMKSEFISLASHQLRTPLTAIGWYIELLQGEQGQLTEDQVSYVEQIIGSHKRMVDLVNSLLNVSRIELGKLKVDPNTVKLKDLVSLTVKELEPQIQKKKIQYTERLPEEIEAYVDAGLVQMVLENLLSNSVKYTNEGGAVELSAILDDKEVRFEIRDTGFGIPKAQQGRIFEKLFRADNVLKTDTVGTGIGLYIARYTTEAWGGKLWFESEEGKGTTFCFTMPLKMEKVEPENGNGNTLQS